MFTLNGTPISIDNEYVAPNGTQYPHLRDPAIRQQLGIVEVADAPWYDQRFYWGVDNPKDLTQLKTQWVKQVKETAGSLLAQSDWMVIRKAERNIDIPSATAESRAFIVAEANRLETAINASANVEALITVVSNQVWHQVTNEVPALTSSSIGAL
jgi:hypothetical protein